MRRGLFPRRQGWVLCKTGLIDGPARHRHLVLRSERENIEKVFY